MLAAIEDGFLDVVGGVKLGGFFLGFLRQGFWVVAREDAAVLGLDRPEAALVVHLRAGELAHASNQVWIPAARPRLPLACGRHCCCLETLTLNEKWLWLGEG